jgi:ACR3 family arsenite efflux pump ArsB
MATMTLSTDDDSSAHTNTIVMDTFEGEKVKMNTKNVDKKKKKKTKFGDKFKNLFPLLVLTFLIILVFIPQSQSFIGMKLNIRGFTLILTSAALVSGMWFIGETLDYI